MSRPMLLAIGLSVLLWTAAAPAGAVLPGDIATMSTGGSCALVQDSHSTGDPDQRWRARHHTIAAVIESVWKSALVHAGLAATTAVRPFEVACAVSSPDPPVRSAPHYLRHTPLLI